MSPSLSSRPLPTNSDFQSAQSALATARSGDLTHTAEDPQRQRPSPVHQFRTMLVEDRAGLETAWEVTSHLPEEMLTADF